MFFVTHLKVLLSSFSFFANLQCTPFNVSDVLLLPLLLLPKGDARLLIKLLTVRFTAVLTV